MIDKRKDLAAQILVWVFALATMTSLVGLVLKKLVHHHARISAIEWFFISINVPATASAVSLFTSGFLFIGLFHRKRIALQIVGLFQLVGVLSSASGILFLYLAGGDRLAKYLMILIGDLVISTALLAVVFWLGEAFKAKNKPGSWLLALVVFLSGSTISLLTCWALVRLTHAEGRFWRHFWLVIFQVFGIESPHSWNHIIAPRIITRGVSLFLALTIIATVLVFIRSAKYADSWSGSQEIELRQLLAQYGEPDSLGYIATRRDKLLHFSKTRKSVIAYQQFGSVCLASGDPIGDVKDWPEVISSWYTQAVEYGLTPAVLACSETGARLYAKILRFDVLKIGDEAIIDTATFKISSAEMAEVRKSSRKLRRDGYSCKIATQLDLETKELDFLGQATNQWRHGETERGFSMALGRIADPSDPRVIVAQVKDPEGTPVAFMTFVPWGRRGISLDYMRRSPQAPNGANEFLVAELVNWCNNNAISRISLNFAFLRQVFSEAEDVAAHKIEKVNSRILGFFDRFWQLQRLYRSNAKYCPDWQPRFLSVPSMLSIPSVAIASGRAEGFLPIGLSGANQDNCELTQSELEQILNLELPREPDIEANKVLTDQQRHRLRHAEQLKENGIPTNPVGKVDAKPLASFGAELWQITEPVSVIGRLTKLRNHGGVCFADFSDAGVRVQLVLEAQQLGLPQLKMFTNCLDSGDLVKITATPGVSRNQTPSLLVTDWQLLAKAYSPIPWKGMTDPQTKLRKRTLDLLVNPPQLDLLRLRSKAIEAVRKTLIEDGYLEVETPILNTIHGGASARPFKTYINAYQMDLVARIAPELALKKLVIAGLGPVFEIGRNFRNEGADSTHNPEFTVVEAYKPFADYHDMRLLTQRIIQSAAVAIHGKPVMPLGEPGNKKLVDISGDWPVVSVCEAVSEALGEQISIETELEHLFDLAKARKIALKPRCGKGAIIEALYSELVEPNTILPTFYLDFPAETSPLTAPHRSQNGLVERWDLVAGGMELGTAYSELTDPVEQRARLVLQSWKAAGGDEDAMELDEDFLEAMNLGMPPTGGLGIGLDRLVMALTDTAIRQVLAFPFVKPQSEN